MQASLWKRSRAIDGIAEFSLGINSGMSHRSALKLFILGDSDGHLGTILNVNRRVHKVTALIYEPGLMHGPKLA